MPTGYTAELMEKGQDFRTFTLRCARAFGACIMQRDDPMQEEPKKQEPSSYYADALERARKALAELQAMGDTARIHHGIGLKNEAVRSHREWLAKDSEQNARLDAMHALVSVWEPPSADHKGLKDFMLDQIKISRHYVAYIERAIQEAEAKAPVTYFAEAVERAERDVGYYAEGLRKEQERTNGRNEWIEQLYASLP